MNVVKRNDATSTGTATLLDGTLAQARTLTFEIGSSVWLDLDPITGEWSGKLYVSGPRGLAVAVQGDYVVTNSVGTPDVYGAEDFAANFEVV